MTMPPPPSPLVVPPPLPLVVPPPPPLVVPPPLPLDGVPSPLGIPPLPPPDCMTPLPPLIAAFESQFSACAWPEKLDKNGQPKRAGWAYRKPLSELLTTMWDCDAHIVQYVTPTVDVQTANGMRAAHSLRLRDGAESLIPNGYALVLLIVDIDGPLHAFGARIKPLHEKRRNAADDAERAALDGQIAELEAGRPQAAADHALWWSVTQAQIHKLRERSRVIGYPTSGGARLVGWLPEAVPIASPADRAQWTIHYLTILAHLRTAYGLDCDPACSYPECFFRLPHVARGGAAARRVQMIGDAERDDLVWHLETIDHAACLAAASRLWPSLMGTRAPRDTGAASGHAIHVEGPEEIAERWNAFPLAEQERRIALYRRYLEVENGSSPKCAPTGSASAFALIIARAGVIGHGLDPGLVLDLMLEVWNPKCVDEHGRPWPWTEAELRHKVEDAVRSTCREIDYEIPEVRDRRLKEETDRLLGFLRPAGEAGATGSGGIPPVHEKLPTPRRTDIANAERFAVEHANRFRFYSDRGTWGQWDDRRWLDVKKSKVEVMEAAKNTVRRMLADAVEIKDEHERKAAVGWALASSERKLLNAIVALAESEPTLRAQAGEMDRRPDLLTVDNGTIDLRNGTLRPHDRSDLITKLTAIKYDAAATCPRWEQFLREVFARDEELIRFVQRAVGYSLTGHTREHAFFILYGTGKNGKGRFVRQLMALGGDAAQTTRFQTFIASREQESGNTPALAALAGCRRQLRSVEI